jgi:hypothetical protein
MKNYAIMTAIQSVVDKWDFHATEVCSCPLPDEDVALGARVVCTCERSELYSTGALKLIKSIIKENEKAQ